MSIVPSPLPTACRGHPRCDLLIHGHTASEWSKSPPLLLPWFPQLHSRVMVPPPTLQSMWLGGPTEVMNIAHASHSVSLALMPSGVWNEDF